MKTPTRAIASVLALAGLCWTVASQATSLAELPLKASVLAKPNVVFAFDNSGSMDFEIINYGNDGSVWWNFTDGTGWGVDATHPNPSLRTITAPWFYPSGTSSSTWRKFSYLFPNGTGTGNRQYGDNANDHFAVLPTTQFAVTRWSGVYQDAAGTYRSAPTDPASSPMHNTLYYNPLITYAPWAPAQLSTGAVTPANATTTAAKSHPILGTFTFNLTADVAANTGAARVFIALPGMRIPAGASISQCSSTNGSCGAWSAALGADTNAAAGAVTRVSMAYYPATYWVRESCTVPATASVGTDACTYLPGSTTITLKRYEIKAGNTFPSGRSYPAEMQNFANWFQYHRKRKLMLAGAMGDTLENLSGMRLGVVPYSANSTTPRIYDADAASATVNRLRVAGIFYETEASGGTPTRETLKFVSGLYSGNDSTGASIVQYACQRNNAFVVTDGFAYATAVTVPAYQSGKTAATWGSGAPYETIYSSSLADLALRYYTNNPRTDLATGRLPATATDLNTDLHVNTYGLSLGARGTVWLGESTPVPTSTGTWPVPDLDRNPTSIDDLWHATINGRGKMYLATTPEETALRIRAGLDDILSQDGAQASIGVSSVNLGRGDDFAYLGSYNTRGWSGDLTRNAANNATGAITPYDPAAALPGTWSANALLTARSWGTRFIFGSNDAAGLAFTSANFGAAANPDSATYTNDQIINYLRGNRSGEGDTVRARTSLIGAVINAEPVVSRTEGVVYLASGEGMLHAFDTATGSELWAYQPPDTLAAAGQSAQRGWVFRTQLDATPTYAQLSSSSKLLVGGLGAAGRSYYALDVSNPRPATEAEAAAQYRWVFPATTDTTNRALMGYTVGRPVVAKVMVGGAPTNVVLVSSGYDNGQSIGDAKGRMWMLNATTGAVMKTFRTTEGSAGDEAGLVHLSAFKDADGSVRYVYGGDLKGNLWRFDLSTAGAGTHDGTLVATFYDAAGNRQPVTSAPELVWQGTQRVVLVGTGRLLDINDFGSTRTQTFYAVADGSTIANARSTLVARTYNRVNDDGTAASTPITGPALDWATQRGWYMDLPTGEQANTHPVVTYGTIAFVTNKQGGSDCSQSSYLYLVNIADGLKVAGSTFAAALVSSNATSSRVITLRVVGGQVYGTTHRSDNTVFQRQLPIGTTIPPSKNAWRELRR
ncbi:MAG: PQQ-binding-like beta-propeller repeat protein [Rubrivivax sp.]|nr:PQQ-binding-like beta-propeller repeat protein [Rubrivivax sp.]